MTWLRSALLEEQLKSVFIDVRYIMHDIWCKTKCRAAVIILPIPQLIVQLTACGGWMAAGDGCQARTKNRFSGWLEIA